MFLLEDIHSAVRSPPEVRVFGAFKLSSLSVPEEKLSGASKRWIQLEITTSLQP